MKQKYSSIFLTSTPDSGKRSVHFPARTHQTQSWVYPKADLDIGKREFLPSGSEPKLLSHATHSLAFILTKLFRL
jgi:hypothetical protein